MIPIIEALVTDSAKLAQDIRAAADKAGPDGARVNRKEWLTILDDAARLAKSIGLLIVHLALA